MAMNKYDLVFLKHFAQVIAVLFGIMLLLILAGVYINGMREPEMPPRKAAELAARIAPVGAAYAGDSGRSAMLAAQEAAKAAAAAQVAYEGTLDGGVIYGKLCHACHEAGVGGAPAMTQAAWGSRVAKGEATLVQHAIAGFDGDALTPMPARGGNPSLTDEQVESTVKWMLANLK